MIRRTKINLGRFGVASDGTGQCAQTGNDIAENSQTRGVRLNSGRSIAATAAGMKRTIDPVGSGGSSIGINQTIHDTFRILNAVFGKAIIIVTRIKHTGQLQLPHVAHARNTLRPELGLRQSRQQHGRQNRNNGDHHQQFNQRKSILTD